MASNTKNWSCRLKKSWDNKKDMFDDLFKYKVKSSDLKAVVDVSKEVEIAFLSEEALRSFVTHVPDEWGCAHELEDEITVTVSPMFGSGHTYVQDGVLRTALERKGKVLSGKRCVYTECPGVENGVRMFKMKDVEGLGGSLRFGAAVFKVQFRGQRKRCFHCNSVEHEARDCTNKLCFKCNKGGHKADSCAEKPICSACGEEGHIHRKCSKSYANRCQLSSHDWMVFDDDDLPFKEIMSGGQMKTSDVTPQSQESTITTLDLKIRPDSDHEVVDETQDLSQDLFSQPLSPQSQTENKSQRSGNRSQAMVGLHASSDSQMIESSQNVAAVEKNKRKVKDKKQGTANSSQNKPLKPGDKRGGK